MRRNLDGMIVAITGASSGIGRALAVILARRGCRLALAARRLEVLTDLNRELGGQHHVYRCDVAVPDECEQFIRQTQADLGRIDTLVCNAGIGLFRRAALTTAEDWHHLLEVNLLGTSECLRAVVPLMRRQPLRQGWRGQIMITSSVLALRGTPDYAAYCATKAAQLMLAQAARVELSADRIAVTSVHPAGTETDFNANAEVLSQRTKLAPPRWEMRMSAEAVARTMCAAIVRPRPEVWPKMFSRTIFHLLSWCPRLADAILARHRRVE